MLLFLEVALYHVPSNSCFFMRPYHLYRIRLLEKPQFGPVCIGRCALSRLCTKKFPLLKIIVEVETTNRLMTFDHQHYVIAQYASFQINSNNL